MTYQIETITVSAAETPSSQMEVFLFEPEGVGPHPALILAQHIPVGHTGIENDTFTLKAAERLAEAGFLVAAPFIFHWWPKDGEMLDKARASRDDWTVADLEATWNLLATNPSVDSGRIGIIGHCWGGRVAWLGAAHLDVAACAVFYGGRIKLALTGGKQQTEDHEFPTAISLANQIHCPMIGFFGNDDENPSPADVQDYSNALSSAGVSHTFHQYDGAGHAFQNFPNPERYREAQSEDAWRKVLDFFQKTLRPGNTER